MDSSTIITLVTALAALIGAASPIIVSLIQSIKDKSEKPNGLYVPSSYVLHRPKPQIRWYVVLAFAFLGGFVGYSGAKLASGNPFNETPTNTPTSTITPVIFSTETPTTTSTISILPSPTATASQTPTVSEIVPTATPNYPAILDLCSDKVKAPCIYKVVKDGDSYTNIAFVVYGSYFHASKLMLFNRDSSGKTIILQKGFQIVCHSLDNLPALSYPMCQANGTFPCQYISQKSDTFSTIAEIFYGNEVYKKFLQDQNIIYGLSQTEVDLGFIPENTVIIIPTKP